MRPPILPVFSAPLPGGASPSPVPSMPPSATPPSPAPTGLPALSVRDLRKTY